jgi:hypothetical protein
MGLAHLRRWLRRDSPTLILRHRPMFDHRGSHPKPYPGLIELDFNCGSALHRKDLLQQR